LVLNFGLKVSMRACAAGDDATDVFAVPCCDSRQRPWSAIPQPDGDHTAASTGTYE